MRPINTDDAFEAARLLDDSGLRAEIQGKLVEISKSGKDIDLDNIGVGTVLDIIRLFVDKGVQHKLYALLAGPYEMTPEEVGKMPIKGQIAAFKTLAADEGLHDFFDLLAGLMASGQTT